MTLPEIITLISLVIIAINITMIALMLLRK